MVAGPRIATALACFASLTLFGLSPAIGSIASIVAVLVMLLLTPAAFTDDSWGRLRAQPAMLIFPAVFGVLTFAFAVTARHSGDVLFAANFFALLLAPAVYLLASGRPGARTMAILAAFFVLGTMVGALTASYDVFIQHKARAIGWGSGGNLMARTVIPLGFLALVGIFVSISRWRWLYLLGPAFAIFTLYLTGTRGVFIALPVLASLFFLTTLDVGRRPRSTYVALTIALVIVVALLVTVASPRFLGVGEILREVASGTAVSDAATSQRLYKFTAGIQTFLKSPWLGVGWANITEASKPFVIDQSYHNDTLNIGVAAGIIGISSWLAVLAAPILGLRFVRADRFSRLRLYGASLLVLSLFIFGLTDMTFGYDLPTTLYAFLTAIVLGAFREPRASFASFVTPAAD